LEAKPGGITEPTAQQAAVFTHGLRTKQVIRMLKMLSRS